jgi:hypothetical protein
MSVKKEIEKHLILLNIARSLNYAQPGSTLGDLKRELEAALAVATELATKYGESAELNDTRRKATASSPRWVKESGPPVRTFAASTEGENRLGMREICQDYIDEQWLAAHMTDEQAAESLLDQFKRAVRAELELLTVEAKDVDPPGMDQ